MKKWIQEPLLHFLLIGAALFLLYAYKNDGYVDYDNRIVISKADINRLVMLWGKKWQRPPSQLELEGLLEQQIREEVLYREALAMGLDQDDSIVRRRMAQKVEFISSDLADQIEPSDAALTEYLAENPDRFEVPARIGFLQIYLSSDRHGAATEDQALALLEQLTEPEAEVDILNAGDPFMFGQQHENLDPLGVSRIFGSDFSDQLFQLPIGSWQGPVQSGYGLHVVLIENKIPSRQPDLAEVREGVSNEWLAEQRRSLNEALYQSLRKRYEVVVEEFD